MCGIRKFLENDVNIIMNRDYFFDSAKYIVDKIENIMRVEEIEYDYKKIKNILNHNFPEDKFWVTTLTVVNIIFVKRYLYLKLNNLLGEKLNALLVALEEGKNASRKNDKWLLYGLVLTFRDEKIVKNRTDFKSLLNLLESDDYFIMLCEEANNEEIKIFFANLFLSYVFIAEKEFRCKKREKIAHYTSCKSFKKIIETAKIKFSHSKKVNDLDEGRLLTQKKHNSINFFSLTTKIDSLDMWGNYTKHTGVCMVFDRKEIEYDLSFFYQSFATNEHNGKWNVYKINSGMISYNDEIRDEALSFFKKFKDKLSINFIWMKKDIENLFQESLEEISWLFKKPPFEYENEVRFYITNSKLETIINDSKTNKGKGYYKANYEYKKSKKEFWIKKEFNKSSLLGIIVSSNLSNDENIEFLENLLKTNGFENVYVEKSNCNFVYKTKAKKLILIEDILNKSK